MEMRRVLSVAAATRGVAYVLFDDGKLVAWGISRKAWRSTVCAGEVFQKWIDQYEPTLIITEKILAASKKGRRARTLTTTLQSIASHNYAYDICVLMNRRGKTRYAFAKELSEIYPDLKPRLPRGYAWYDPAPLNLLIFDALTLANEVLRDPTLTIAQHLDSTD